MENSLLNPIYGCYVHTNNNGEHTMVHFLDAGEAAAYAEQAGGEALDFYAATKVMGALFDDWDEDEPAHFTDDDIAAANYDAICATLSASYGEWYETTIVPPVHSSESPMWVLLQGAYEHEKAGTEIRVWMLGDDECFEHPKGFYQYVADDETKKVFKAFYESRDNEGVDIPLDEIDYSRPWMLEEIEYDSLGWY